MKLGFSSNAFKRFELEEALRLIAEIGYTGVEILGDVPHAFPPDLTPERIERIKAVLRETGLEVANVNAFMTFGYDSMLHPSWLEPDEDFRAKRLKHTIDCLRLAKELGATAIQTEPGGPVPESVSEAEALDLFEAGIGQALPLAEELAVHLLIEPEPGHLIENTGQMEAFLKRFDSPWLGVNFDIGHFYCVREDIPAAIERLGTAIRHVHLEDIAASREHFHLIPGHGAIDFPPIFDALDDIGYGGYVTVELYTYEENPVEAARKALDYVRRLS